ncbi:MAG: hypothetical protein ACT4PO_11200 [Actinomycetota bacterium]
MPLWTPPPYPHSIEQGVRGGTTLTSSATVDTKGAWTQLIAATATDACGIWVAASGISGGATVTAQLLDIGIGPVDPPEIIVPDWNIGAASSGAGAPPSKAQFWPIFIPAGSKVWGRIAALIASDTALVRTSLMESLPYGLSTLENVTAYGVTVAGSKGINATSGAGVYGAWVDLANTSRDHRAWAVGLGQGADATLNANEGISVQLGVGTVAQGPEPIGTWEFQSTASEIMSGPLPPWPIWQPVLSGTGVSARILAGATTDVFDIIAYGLG